MDQYINTKDIRNIFEHLTDEYAYTGFLSGIYVAKTWIEDIKPADVEPVRHGKWIMDKKWGTAICSECKFEIEDDYFWRAGDFRPWEGCPICRSKMDGEVEE